MESNTTGSCGRCVLFQPHDTFTFLGFCKHTNELMIKSPAKGVCEAFEEVSLDDSLSVLSLRGWLRCRSCNRALFTVEELRDHLDDEVGGEVFSDDVASEEAPSAS